MINGIPFPPKNQGDASIWETNNLPALEYCDLNRAANLLNCKVADLLHWAEIGAIELCLKFNAFRASIKSIDLNTKYRNNPNDWIKGNDSNLLIVFYVQIMPDDFVMQLHRF